MTEQLKAEAYVRKQRPALYKPEYSVCSAHQVALDKECDTCQSGWMSPNLQDWLAVLGYTPKSIIDRHDTMSISKYGRWVFFDLTTGQPATEADYKAFNKIVSV